MPEVYLAAGSNVDAERHLTLAAAELERVFGPVRFSPWYRNAAVGFDGPDFINFAAGFATELPVREVIANLRAIEAICGRPRAAPKWAPRGMDLDILLYDGLVCDEPGLRIPRPDLVRRAYMLGPLAAIAPDFMHPTAGATIRELWARFDRASHPLERIDPSATSTHSDRRPPRASGR
ncbi:MAG TPA: 2-amino-4-hydroxy-6-hydroxymethyldihydropteridine diphosphokinase [Steroidobacteraceae bacterium]|nr:2-amino-4-hydroxy-6-hydroxymethyldihydropteridine diphosphokinase [Steroidobacteraceae bacterium]